MSKREHTYTKAQIVASKKVPDIVHINSQDLINEITIILTQDEFVGEIIRWLLMRPIQQRQIVIDELVACTLRTLEVSE